MFMLTFASVNSRPGFFTISSANQIFATVDSNTGEVVTKRDLAPEETASIKGFLSLSSRKSRRTVTTNA
jgi:hypothetical protein